MKECERLIVELPVDDGYDGCLTLIAVEEQGFRKGWRAALEWTKKEAIASDERGDINRVVINRELEEER